MSTNNPSDAAAKIQELGIRIGEQLATAVIGNKPEEEIAALNRYGKARANVREMHGDQGDKIFVNAFHTAAITEFPKDPDPKVNSARGRLMQEWMETLPKRSKAAVVYGRSLAESLFKLALGDDRKAFHAALVAHKSVQLHSGYAHAHFLNSYVTTILTLSSARAEERGVDLDAVMREIIEAGVPQEP